MNHTAVTPTGDPFVDFGIQLLATLIGAFAGFGLVILWDRKKRKDEEKKTKFKILNSLSDEIEQIQNKMKTVDGFEPLKWIPEKQVFGGNYFTISLSSFENALYSGHLVLFSLELQEQLSHLQHSIMYYNFFLKETFTFHKAFFDDKNVQNRHAARLIRELGTTSSEVKDDINKVVPLLKKEKEDLT